MERVSIGELDPDRIGDGADRWPLSPAVGATGVALNRYRIAPGGGFPGGLHAHADQEEVFVVLAGEAVFRTLDDEISVGAGEAVRFGPGEFQTGSNESGDPLVVLAVGAPRDTDDVRVPLSCPECCHGDLRVESDGGDVELVCPECSVRHVPAGCPECGHDDMEVRPGNGREADDGGRSTLVVCPSCGATFDRPPLRE